MQFTNIKFLACYGDEDKSVSIDLPNGTSNVGFNIMVNNYLYGRMFKRNNEWVGFFNVIAEVTGADITELGNIIDEQLLKNFHQ